MFNGYNETPLISYEFSQERVEKKQENVPKWTYGQGTGVQPAQSHPNSRHSEFWSGKSCFLGLSNVKCNCTSCYPSSENQSYQGDTARHRPWLPRTFPVPLNGSNESCKLPAYQWDNGYSNQGSCYPERNFPFTQESDGKYPYYNQYETSRLSEPNQPGVITSVKDVEYAKKPKNDIYPLSQESSIQNGTKQPVFCNPAYNLTKRVDGRNYCNPNEKYSNVASYSVDQHISRLPVVEPFIKAVPSNLSQNRVPSTGYHSVKETVPQSYIDSGYCSDRKICTELVNSGEKKSEGFSACQLQSGIHLDYSQFNRELSEIEPQKLFFDNTRHPDYYSRSNFQDLIKRNSQILDNRKDCAINQISPPSMSDQIYGMYRSKYQEIGNSKPPCDTFCPKDVEKARPGHQVLENAACFERNEEKKNENTNAHSRLPRSALLFNDPRFDERSLNSFPYQSNPASCRNYLRPELAYQPGFNLQPGFEYPAGLQRNDVNQYRVTLQQMQSCEQFTQQENSTFVYDPHCQRNSDKTQQICGGKNPSPVQTDSQPFENRKTNYLEAIRSEEVNKNGATKISPLRLLRKKKFINVPQESAPVSTLDAAPGLDVRKFWSTWAEEEEENVAPTQMVVLDCQNIDPEQAKLLHLCETDPIRAVHLESGSIIIKNSGCLKESTNQAVHFEEIKTCEQKPASEPETDKQANAKNENEASDIQLREDTEKVIENNLAPLSEPEYKSPPLEPFGQVRSPSGPFRRTKSAHENRGKKKTETMDKWTEKKFDFLKRAEESKAAEILRHEEEKKKILQTRLSLQQSSKKTDKPKERCFTEKTEGASENFSPFDENSRNDSPRSESTDVSSLPTSEYRRNKFLDYSDRKIIVNGKDKFERGTVEKGSICTNPFMADEATELDEMKKEENVKLECSDKRPIKHPTEKVFPSLNAKLKDEAIFEMDDILKRISEINFQNPEVRLENGLEDVKAKKLRPSAKKAKKKKSENQPENGERTDKVTVETVTKPTIKFSIQKSHDLKISFKVLNSSKEYSDEDGRGEDAEAKGSAIEDSKNSTELITLKYKSIQRDGDKTQISNSKKGRRGFRRKRGTPDMKTPVLKIKKSRYLPQGKRDPLSRDDADLNVSKKPCADESSVSDNFQVQETVDSAKIKLTFKRHKGNFQTEYKINSSNLDKLSECDPVPEECDKHVHMTTSRSRKKSRRTKRHEVFADAGVEYFQNYQASDVENDSESRISQLETSLEEGSRNSSVSRNSFTEEKNSELEPEAPTLSEYSSDLELPIPKNESQDYSKLMVPEEFEEDFAVEVSKLNKERDKFSEEAEPENHLINCLEDDESGKKDTVSLSNFSGFPEVNVKKIKPGEVRLAGKCEEEKADSEKVEIQEISLDFARNTKSLETEISHKLGEAEEAEKLDDECYSDAVKEKIFFEENISEIKHSGYLEESDELKFEKNIDDEKTCEIENSKITQNLGTWKKNVVGSNDVDGLYDDCFDNGRVRQTEPEETLATTTPLPAFALCPVAEEAKGSVNEKKIRKARLSCEKITEPCLAECISAVKENCVNKSSPELIDSSAFELEINGACSENSNKDIARYDSESDFSACGKNSSSEMSVKSIKNPRDDFKNPRDVEAEILNEFADEHQKTPNPARLTSEGPKRSNLDSSENLMVNSSGNNLGCFKMSSEVVESVLEKNSDDGVEYKVCCSRFESTTFDQLIKSDVEEVPENRAVECAQGFSLAKSPHLAFEKKEFPRINLENQSPSLNSEASCSKKQDNIEPSGDDLSFSWKALSSKIASEEMDNLSVDVEPNLFKDDNSSKKNDDGNVKEINLPNCGTECNENLQPSPKTNVLEQMREQFLTDDLACVEDSSTIVKAPRSAGTHEVWIDSKHRIITQDVETDLPSQTNVELEDGEIVDSSDEAEKISLCKEQSSDGAIQAPEKLTNFSEFNGKNGHFIYRKIERRHSEVSNQKKESKNSELETWSKRKFSKAKSCPPELKYLGVVHKKINALHIPVEDIPLPLGPPPYESCLSFKKYKSLSGIRTESCCTEAKEKPKESISCDRLQNIQKEIFQPNSPFGVNDLQNCRNPSPPQYDGDDSLDILHRTSKIKFSFTKRSRFSKFLAKNSQLEVPSQAFNTGPKAWEEPENSDSKVNKKIGTPDCVEADQNSTPKDCQNEEVPNANVANEKEEPKNCSGLEEIRNSKTCSEQPVELCENLDESIEVIDAMSDFIRDEFYECEDIPTSEDLTYADDLESEKVNDDKFRNIMQNCLDNAKKFLTVGNLKLFSCSVDDLLELDCQAAESTLGENETERPTNHISRDVLLTSCEDTNDDLGLSENVQATDISMDFVPSFGSDACPEILPVDNWPYLEEEVPSSPVKFKQDDTNLIQTLENPMAGNSSEIQIKFCSKNKTERPGRKRGVSETGPKGFRRRSIICDGEALGMCSKIDAQRRKTVDSFTTVSYESDVHDIKSELLRLKIGSEEIEKSLKCRLSLEKLASNKGISFEFKKEDVKMFLENSAKPQNGMQKKSAESLDYESPLWQPKVVLFRISKLELKKILRSSKTHSLLESKISGDSPKREITPETENEITHSLKKLKSDSRLEKLTARSEHKDGRIGEMLNAGNLKETQLISLPRLDSIKGSFTAVSSTNPDVRKRKKSRFRNLHTKTKPTSKEVNSTAQKSHPSEPILVEGETAVKEGFKDGGRVSTFHFQSTKQVSDYKSDCVKQKKKLSEIEPSAFENHLHANFKSERRLEKEFANFKGKTKEDSTEDKHREICDKKHDYRYGRKETKEDREQRKSKDKHRENQKRKHSSSRAPSYDRSRHPEKKSPNGNKHIKSDPDRKNEKRYRQGTTKGDEDWKTLKEAASKGPWICDVCGFDDADERILHIKNHPFHCQSCHLAFKTETHFIDHLTKRHKHIRNQHHCLLCELSFDTEEQYQSHLETREHRHLESVEKNTINTLFTLLTGAPCPVLGVVEMKPEWLPNQAGTVHFYHQATPLSLALQYLKMHDLSSFSTASSAHPT